VSRLKVTAAIPDTEVSWIVRGREAMVSLDAWPDRTFPATVAWIAPEARGDSRTFDVELGLDNRDGTLKPGLVARVDLVKKSVEDGIVVPLDALVTRVDGRLAFVVEECVARARDIRLAAQEGDRGLVAAGLEAGDALVVDGQADLADGQAVSSESCP
jgi:membrane fusion protein (multidrug efflux system)